MMEDHNKCLNGKMNVSRNANIAKNVNYNKAAESKKFSIEESFEYLFLNFNRLLDYYESDLGEFLSLKFFKKYYLLIALKVFVIIAYLCTFSLFIFMDASIINTTYGIISIGLFIGFYYVDKLIYKKQKYSAFFFQRKRRRIIKYRDQLNLILNNNYLAEKYDKNNLNNILVRANKLKSRIDYIDSVVKPYHYYLKKFAIPTLLFAPIITFVINLLFYFLQNPTVLTEGAEITRFFLGLAPFSLILFQEIRNIVEIKKKRKVEESSIYLFLEGIIFLFLEIIRLNLRIIQFPNEENLKKKLLIIMKELVKNPPKSLET